MTTVCVVTGTRAEYGLLRPVIRALRADDRFRTQVVATGSHLSPEFGTTVREIEADGIAVDARLEVLLSSDTPVGVSTSLALTTLRTADVLERLRPDLLLVLGDRYEILGVAQAALIAHIPVAHLSGGDITEGAIDDAIRHAVTKLSHLHLVFTDEAAGRVRQLGEDPARIVVTGNPGLDELLAAPVPPRAEVGDAVGLRLRDHNLLVTYHPATLADEPPAAAFQELLAALDALGDGYGVILTLPNADTDGRVLIELAQRYAERRDHVVAHHSLGATRYAACLRTVDAVVGNSSSGLIEAPAVGTPAVNIGARQRGRLRGHGVIDCPPERDRILAAIEHAVAWEGPTSSPYGDGAATAKIVATLAAVDDPRALLHKRFHAI